MSPALVKAFEDYLAKLREVPELVTVRSAMEAQYSQLDAGLRQALEANASRDEELRDNVNLERSLGRMLAVSESWLDAVVAYLAENAVRLQLFVDAMNVPRDVAGADLFRDGSFALASDSTESTDRAITILTAAVSTDKSPMHASAWFNLGVALQKQKKTGTQAAEAFSNCARNCVKESPELASMAVFLAAACFRAADQTDKSEQVLTDFAAKIERCAEIYLALAIHHSEGDDDYLLRALRLAPNLVIDAIAYKAPFAAKYAADACDFPNSPSNWLLRLDAAMTKAFTAARAAHLEGLSTLPYSPSLLVPGPEALLRDYYAMHLALTVAGHLSDEITAQLMARRTMLAEQTEQRDKSLEASKSRILKEADKAARQIQREYKKRIRQRRRVEDAQLAKTLRDTAAKIEDIQQRIDETYALATSHARAELRESMTMFAQLLQREREIEFALRRYAFSRVVEKYVVKSSHVVSPSGSNFFNDLRSYFEADQAYWSTIGRNPIGSDGIVYPDLKLHFEFEIKDLRSQRLVLVGAIREKIKEYADPLVQAGILAELLSQQLELEGESSAQEQECLAEYNRVLAATCRQVAADRYSPALYYMRPLEHDLRETWKAQQEQIKARAKSATESYAPGLESIRSDVARELERAKQQDVSALAQAIQEADAKVAAAHKKSQRIMAADITRLEVRAASDLERAEQEKIEKIAQADKAGANEVDAAKGESAQLDEADQSLAELVTIIIAAGRSARVIPYQLPQPVTPTDVPDTDSS